MSRTFRDRVQFAYAPTKVNMPIPMSRMTVRVCACLWASMRSRFPSEWWRRVGPASPLPDSDLCMYLGQSLVDPSSGVAAWRHTLPPRPRQMLITLRAALSI